MHLMSYLKGTQDMVLTLEEDNLNMMRWFVDGSHIVRPDCRGCTGAGLTLVKGSAFSKNTKEKINSKSSTETELIASDDVLSQVLWSNYFMRAQGWTMNQTIVYQDNKSAMLLESNGQLSSSQRTKHINVRYYFIKD